MMEEVILHHLHLSMDLLSSGMVLKIVLFRPISIQIISGYLIFNYERRLWLHPTTCDFAWRLGRRVRSLEQPKAKNRLQTTKC